jgi:hypothetical protein
LSRTTRSHDPVSFRSRRHSQSRQQTDRQAG